MKFSQFALATACVLASANGFQPMKPAGFGIRQVRSDFAEGYELIGSGAAEVGGFGRVSISRLRIP